MLHQLLRFEVLILEICFVYVQCIFVSLTQVEIFFNWSIGKKMQNAWNANAINFELCALNYPLLGNGKMLSSKTKFDLNLNKERFGSYSKT